MLTTDYSDDTDMKNLCACNPKEAFQTTKYTNHT